MAPGLSAWLWEWEGGDTFPGLCAWLWEWEGGDMFLGCVRGHGNEREGIR